MTANRIDHDNSRILFACQTNLELYIGENFLSCFLVGGTKRISLASTLTQFSIFTVGQLKEAHIGPDEGAPAHLHTLESSDNTSDLPTYLKNVLMPFMK